jgi:predicted nucleic acid-binding protein
VRFLDTNILLYSISTDRAEARKQAIAVNLIDGADNALSVQVLQEFYVQATRAGRQNPLSHDVAVELIGTWLRFPIQETTIAVMSCALSIKSEFGFSYWDSAIVAAAQALGCSELCSEDMSHGVRVGDLTIHNPFR